jgi:N-acetylmuramoyl-L-alanine amidase
VTGPDALIRRYTLALCVWREARGESARGKRLVAQVIENRVQDRRWPDTYVSVITQPWQFSAFNKSDPNVHKFPDEGDPAWRQCVAAADAVLEAAEPFTDANHYHVAGLTPAWRDDDKLVAAEGHHVFYRL